MKTKPEYCTRPEVESCSICSLVNYGLDCMNNPVQQQEPDELPTNYQLAYDALNLNPGAKTPHLDALQSKGLLDTLPTEQITIIVNLMQQAYMSGRSSTGAEKIDIDAIWVKGTGMIEEQVDGNWIVTAKDKGIDLTTTQAAKQLGISDSRVRQLITAGKLPANKMGRDLFIKSSDLDEFAKLDRPAGNPNWRLEWYLLNRDEEYKIVSVTPGNDPLYGNGSWNCYAGPFASWEDADSAAPID